MASFVKLILSVVGPTLFILSIVGPFSRDRSQAQARNAIGDVPGVNAANAAHADESKV